MRFCWRARDRRCSRKRRRRKLDVRALTFRALAAAAKQADLVHVHDARAHTHGGDLEGRALRWWFRGAWRFR